MTASVPTQPARNVILLGEAGSGKTSIINMVAGNTVAPISNGLTGTTCSAVYPIQIGGSEYAVYDTPGIDSTKLAGGTDPAIQLVEHLPDGVGLLVFCMRGRITEDAAAIYQHFSRSLFQGVPAVGVITGLEHEHPMESWWTKNQSVFEEYEMLFDDHACVTTLRGKGSMFASQYEESVTAVRNLIAARCMKDGQRAELQSRQVAPAITTDLPIQQQRRRRYIIILATTAGIVVLAVIIVAVVVSRHRGRN